MFDCEAEHERDNGRNDQNDHDAILERIHDKLVERTLTTLWQTVVAVSSARLVDVRVRQASNSIGSVCALGA